MHKFNLIKTLTVKKFLEQENPTDTKDIEAYNILGVVINSIQEINSQCVNILNERNSTTKRGSYTNDSLDIEGPFGTFSSRKNRKV